MKTRYFIKVDSAKQRGFFDLYAVYYFFDGELKYVKRDDENITVLHSAYNLVDLELMIKEGFAREVDLNELVLIDGYIPIPAKPYEERNY